MKSVYPDYQRLMESWIIVGVAAPARMPVKLKNQKTIKNHKNQKTKKPKIFLKNHWFLPALPYDESVRQMTFIVCRWRVTCVIILTYRLSSPQVVGDVRKRFRYDIIGILLNKD
jgi:hypothetical protein